MNIKIVFFCTVLLCLLNLSLSAQDSWKLDSSAVIFHISNAGLDVEGSIEGVTTDIKFAQNKLSRSHIHASAKSETIQTGIKLRDKHLKKADYFDVEKHPTIKISSTGFKKTKNGFMAQSSVTIKGQTKLINIPFSFSQTGNKAVFKGSFLLNRLDFGIGETSLVLSDTVEVEFVIFASSIK